MKFLKTLFLLGLCTVQSLAEPIPPHNRHVSVRDEASPVQLAKRANPTISPNVGIGEVMREKVGETLYTNGLLTCIAVVVIGEKNIDKASWDKIMAHIASNLCQDGEIPGLDDQLNDLFEMDTDTKYLVNRKAFVITAPDAGNAALAAFNQYVLGKAQNHWGSAHVQRVIRDQTNVNEPGGSRLWTDGDRNTYWGKDGTLIVPAI
ncbi:hypothetical protein SUNI508_06716 [Seiridium unicorne]|uniref:Uncharacterized protein n=1 Tax=Seiridium unicorne TaxID=138068 RepID=A0ABR2UZR7_9PEZI